MQAPPPASRQPMRHPQPLLMDEEACLVMQGQGAEAGGAHAQSVSVPISSAASQAEHAPSRALHTASSPLMAARCAAAISPQLDAWGGGQEGVCAQGRLGKRAHETNTGHAPLSAQEPSLPRPAHRSRAVPPRRQAQGCGGGGRGRRVPPAKQHSAGHISNLLALQQRTPRSHAHTQYTAPHHADTHRVRTVRWSGTGTAGGRRGRGP